MIACSGTASGPIFTSAASIASASLRARKNIAFGERDEDVSPAQQRLQRRRDRPQRGKRRARLMGAIQLQQRQRVAEPPGGARRGGSVRRGDRLQQIERLLRSLLLQEIGGEVEPRPDVLGIARDKRSQKTLRRRPLRRKCA